MRKLAFGLLIAFVLSGCGYHLVGHGGDAGAIPAEVETISLIGNGEPRLMSQLRQRLQSDRYRIVLLGNVTDKSKHATVHVKISPVVFVPSAYDAAGVATQYRMVFTGSVAIERQGATVWQSGPIQQQGDVYVTGGPASIEASRERLQRDMTKQWISDAADRIRSGF